MSYGGILVEASSLLVILRRVASDLKHEKNIVLKGDVKDVIIKVRDKKSLCH